MDESRRESIESIQLDYVGDELTIFALAKHWKAYFTELLAPFIKGTVAEVGPGLGATTQALCDPAGPHTWLCVEPDKKMSTELQRLHAEGTLPERCEIFSGILG